MTAIEAAPFTRKFLQNFVQSSADKNLFRVHNSVTYQAKSFNPCNNEILTKFLHASTSTWDFCNRNFKSSSLEIRRKKTTELQFLQP